MDINHPPRDHRAFFVLVLSVYYCNSSSRAKRTAERQPSKFWLWHMNMHNSCVLGLVADDDSLTDQASILCEIFKKQKSKRKRKMPEIPQRRGTCLPTRKSPLFNAKPDYACLMSGTNVCVRACVRVRKPCPRVWALFNALSETLKSDDSAISRGQ